MFKKFFIGLLLMFLLAQTVAAQSPPIPPLFVYDSSFNHPNPALNDAFGSAIAIDGDMMVVGAPYRSDGAQYAGIAYVFVWNGTAWAYQATLSRPSGGQEDHFGSAVAISGDTVVVGSPGTNAGPIDSGIVYVFTRTASVWTQQTTLFASNSASFNGFGRTVAISGDTLVVGVPGWDIPPASEVGAVEVFTRSASTWTRQTTILPTNPSSLSNFGWSLDLQGTTLAVGEPGGAGAVYIYQGSGASWMEQVKLLPAVSNLVGRFGYALQLKGTQLIIGSPSDDRYYENVGLVTDAGSVYVFSGSGASWSQDAHLFSSDSTSRGVGFAVDFDGDIVIASGGGFAYLFLRNGTQWSTDRRQNPLQFFEKFGQTVAIRGLDVYVGAPGRDLTGASGAGVIHHFRLVLDIDMGVEQTAVPNPGFTDTNLVFTVTVTNNSPEVAPGVWMVAFLPPIQFVSVSNISQGFCYAPFSDGSLYCSLGTLNPGATASLDITLRTSQIGGVGNIAVTFSDAADVNPDNDTSLLAVGILQPAPPNAPPILNYYTTFTPTLTWNWVSWATAYQLEVSTSSIFAPAEQVYSVVLQGNIFSHQLDPDPPLEVGQVYYWHVRARDNLGNWGSWSAADTFIINGF